MRLTVYKGFNDEFISNIPNSPLVNTSISKKKNILLFNRKKITKQLKIALISLSENDDVWVTYEEYSLIHKTVIEAIKDDELILNIIYNNLFPDYYPIPFDINESLRLEIENVLTGKKFNNISESCQNFLSIYNTLVHIDDENYGSYYNHEYSLKENCSIIDYYNSNLTINKSKTNCDINIFLNDDIPTYLKDLKRIKELSPKTIGIKLANGEISKRLFNTLKAYCHYNNIELSFSNDILPEEKKKNDILKGIAKNDIGIKDFEDFRKIKFYKEPDINNEVVGISQSQIIQEIIKQAENSYINKRGHRDIFITASTGSGKSLMFQIPAIYLAKKYKKLTIIIEPVKALMQDQKEKLIKNGYSKVETFNSDLISQVEKEVVLEKIKNEEVDILYLSPETLLSYSIETIIGPREIGLLIVDEAHIVTTWGMGFRPDYWYLGGYINKLRNIIKTSKGIKQKVYNFPICAFTATAINGGIDDSVSDTIISLYMENPIKYIGYVRRDNIEFNINNIKSNTNLSKADYENIKTEVLNSKIEEWLKFKEKTIVYFPYATHVKNAAKGLRGFSNIIKSSSIGTYTGRNINNLSTENFNESKRQTFESFKNGKNLIMFATKAFGMGIDVNDVKNVYHYAVTGNLCDYVQEIGRAARQTEIKGKAIMDISSKDFSFMNSLFGMSQIKQYQIFKVIQGIFNTYKNKKESRSFLISPESFTYIFNGKGEKNEDASINKLKTCLLMLEKDFYDKYNFKVLISRPQSVFTKTFVCVFNDKKEIVLKSKYGSFFQFLKKGRFKELQPDGTKISDKGDIYSIDLKQIWENFYSNISFPQFKYWYFNSNVNAKDKIEIIPEIRSFIAPRQNISLETHNDLLLSEIRESIFKDFEYISDLLYQNFGKNFFTLDEFSKLIKVKYGKTNSRVIANSIFDLVDPNRKCVKSRMNEKNGKLSYSLAYGNFKEYLRKPICKAKIVNEISKINYTTYSSYINLELNKESNIALKLLSIFNYITYEVTGGEQPEIFIRLNDPDKIESIILGHTFYSNNYVKKAQEKHSRDVEVLLYFFNKLEKNSERWDFIENYFLGKDVLEGVLSSPIVPINMAKLLNRKESHNTKIYQSWEDIKKIINIDNIKVIDKLSALSIPFPEYLETKIKKSNKGNYIIMSWPSKDILICKQSTPNNVMDFYKQKGWTAFKLGNIDFHKIQNLLNLK